MKVFTATNMIGAFAFDEKGRLVHYKLFPSDPSVMAERMTSVKEGDIVKEEEALLKDLSRSGYKKIAWDKKVDFPDMECMYEPDNPAKHALQREFRKLAVELKFAESPAALNKLLSQANILLTKQGLRKERKDVIMMRSVAVVDELDRNMNTLSELMREWYGLYFPEAEKLTKDHAQMAKLISKHPSRNDFEDKKIKKYAKMSAGMPFSEDDLKAVKKYASCLVELSSARENVAEYVRNESRKIMPNLSVVAGPLIACRLLTLAGGLEKLARMSSSTIQLLGAEKALFRHLKSKGKRDKPPKFGVIFAHQLIQNADKQDKGRMARLLSAKLAMAARADFYTKKDISKKLMEDLRKKTLRSGKKPKGGPKK